MLTDTGLENNGKNEPARHNSHAAAGREGDRTMAERDWMLVIGFSCVLTLSLALALAITIIG